MNCRDFQEMIDSYLSDELLTETNHNVLRHLENCGNCRKVIEARREVRSRLKNAVINAPRYQVSSNFAHNLRTQLNHEAFKNQKPERKPRFGFGSWTAVAAGLLLTFTFSFLLLGNLGSSNDSLRITNSHTIANLSAGNLTNIALGDHEYCAIGHDSDEPVNVAKTPAKYENIQNVVMSPLKSVSADCELVESHTCKYKDTDFTHLVVKNEGKTLSVIITQLNDLDKLEDQDILNLASEKYQVSRFDLKDEAVFVISDQSKEMNLRAAQAIYEPLQKHLHKDSKYIQTAFLMAY